MSGTDVSIGPAAIDSVSSRALIDQLDAELRRRYPDAPIFGLHPGDAEAPGTLFLVATVAGTPAACGAFRRLDDDTVEIKRLFVVPRYRRRGLARAILRALEVEATRRGVATVKIETGAGQPEAMALYLSAGYAPIDPFGEYIGNPVSRCFAKTLTRPDPGMHGTSGS